MDLSVFRAWIVLKKHLLCRVVSCGEGDFSPPFDLVQGYIVDVWELRKRSSIRVVR